MSNFRLNSLLFRWVFQKAIKILKSDLALKDLFQEYRKKISRINLKKEYLLPCLEQLQILMRMIIAYKSKNYRNLSYPFIISTVGIVLYFILPFDLVFDFLPGGYLDDIALISYFFHLFEKEIAKFKAWDAKNNLP